jgi:hypothetical protein
MIASDTGALRVTRGAAPVPESPAGSPLVTAEIPAVPGSSSYGVLLPDGSIWYPGSRRRLPAPLLLRMAVWVLAFATLVLAAGDLVIHFHPSWVNPLRRVVASASLPGTRSTGSRQITRGKSGSTATTGGVTKMSPQPSGLPGDTTVYTIGASPYTVEIGANHVTWIGVYSISNGLRGALVDQKTLQGGQTGTFQETGPVDVSVGASEVTVKVLSSGHEIGTITQATPWNFFLEPKAAA